MEGKKWVVLVVIVSLGLFLLGCPKKAVKEEAFAKKTEETVGESDKVAKLEAELKAKEEAAKKALAEKELQAERERAARLKAEEALREKEQRAKEEAAKRALAEKELQAERERAARLEAERQARERELRAKEEEARRALAEKELQAERERAARLEAERQAKEKELQTLQAKKEEPKRDLSGKEKEFEKTLVAKKEPGIEGEVLESKLLKDIHFDFDRYDIRPEDAEILKENAALLIKYPDKRIQIEGHCDERGTAEYNLALGERRAQSARDFLISLGIAPNRITTISYGEEKPLDPSHNEEAWAKNRRCHFVILPK
jgi:peptidoglycan-associated lipoprotein